MAVIPFYGSTRPDIFAIERSAMDRPGHVIAALDRLLDSGLILDVGAGDGFVAGRLGNQRTVVCLEPSEGMRARGGERLWVGGDAERLPFASGSFDAAYATWAYFFPAFVDVSPGLAELDRVVRPGGAICIVDNLGDDGLSSYTRGSTSTDLEFWARNGFSVSEICTSFEFDTPDDARLLLGFYAGAPLPVSPPLTLTFRVAVASRLALPPVTSSGL